MSHKNTKILGHNIISNGYSIGGTKDITGNFQQDSDFLYSNYECEINSSSVFTLAEISPLHGHTFAKVNYTPRIVNVRTSSSDLIVNDHLGNLIKVIKPGEVCQFRAKIVPNIWTYQCLTVDFDNIIIGDNNTNSGEHVIIVGDDNSNSGDNTFIAGSNITNSGDNNNLFGGDINTTNNNQFIVNNTGSTVTPTKDGQIALYSDCITTGLPGCSSGTIYDSMIFNPSTTNTKSFTMEPGEHDVKMTLNFTSIGSAHIEFNYIVGGSLLSFLGTRSNGTSTFLNLLEPQITPTATGFDLAIESSSLMPPLTEACVVIDFTTSF